jgi:hypothetical protein
MIVGEILFGLVSVALGGGLLYSARAKNLPLFVKLFVLASWIKSDAVKRAMCAVMGFGAIISGIVFILAGLTGRRLHTFF